MKEEIKNYGYIEPIITPDNYVLGGIFAAPFQIINETGNWLDCLPKTELQKKGLETKSCVPFGINNCIEIILKKKYNLDTNNSERFLVVVGKQRRYGSDPHKMSEAFRKFGAIKESYLPFLDNMTWEEYFSPNPMTRKFLKLGRKFLDEFLFRHEYLWGRGTSLKEKQNRIIKSLKTSPVGASVVAWRERNGLYYKPDGVRDNHWIVIVGYKENEYWLIFDSYDSFIKKLEFGYDFGIAKRYYIEKKDVIRLSIYEKIVLALSKVVKLLKEIITIKEKAELIIEEPKVEPVIEEPKYKWSTVQESRHSSRVIMDKYGLSWNEKDLLCAVIMAESGFETNAVNRNANGTSDYGICQINSFYWIGEGKYFKSIDEVINFPEKSIRFMIDQYRKGNLRYWTAFVNLSYKKYL